VDAYDCVTLHTKPEHVTLCVCVQPDHHQPDSWLIDSNDSNRQDRFDCQGRPLSCLPGAVGRSVVLRTSKRRVELMFLIRSPNRFVSPCLSSSLPSPLFRSISSFAQVELEPFAVTDHQNRVIALRAWSPPRHSNRSRSNTFNNPKRVIRHFVCQSA
jgi:hypothetical protein